MAAPTQPVQLGTQFMVNFSGGTVPSQSAGYIAKDGWKQTRLFGMKAVVAVNRFASEAAQPPTSSTTSRKVSNRTGGNGSRNYG